MSVGQERVLGDGCADSFINDVFPDLQTFQFGGNLPWWEGDTIQLECPDPNHRVTLELERSKREMLSRCGYLGFRIPAEQIICDGCMAEATAEAPRLIDRACPVRPCVIERALPNCSQCPEYGCEKLVQRWVVYEDIAARMGGAISEEDRARFISPYENKRRLDDLRRQAR